MINGDGNQPDPPDSARSSNPHGGAAAASPSIESSLGESEEFERYCSANSVMNTPSVCSSSSFGPLNRGNDYYSVDSEFGSFKSMEGFSLGDGYNRNFVESRKLSGSGVDFLGGSGLGLSDCREGSGGGGGLDSGGSGLGFDVDVGSENEYDEDDGSMYGSGSDYDDGDPSQGSYVLRNEVKRGNENENPLGINSSIAFGSDDWDDFELETGGGVFASVALDTFQEVKHHDHDDSGRNLVSLDSNSRPVRGQLEVDKVIIDEPEVSERVKGDEVAKSLATHGAFSVASQDSDSEIAEVKYIPLACSKEQEPTGFAKENVSGSTTLAKVEHEDVSVVCNQVQGSNGIAGSLKSCSGSNVFEMDHHQLEENTESGLEDVGLGVDKELQFAKSGEIIHFDDSQMLGSWKTESLQVEVDPLSGNANQACLNPTVHPENDPVELLFEDCIDDSSPLMLETSVSKMSIDTQPSLNFVSDKSTLVKAENVELDIFCDDIVNDMEEILLDTSESPAARFSQSNLAFPSRLTFPLRDGGSTASTSGTDDAYPLNTHILKIDGIEVVGAKQKRGDVSLSERLVGVKEYTVYVIRVWNSDKQWDVERRYRDFFSLYHCLKSFYAEQGWTLPSPWSAVEKESRKIFGSASPDVLAERSVVIQKCLNSVLHSVSLSSLPSAFIYFLSHQDSYPNSPASKAPMSWSTFSNRSVATESVSNFGKTISLIVEIHPHKSVKQMLEEQYYTCAGCHKRFDDGVTLMRDIVQTLGWGKPRLCEYTGQLFCSSCHMNDAAVLPARVLHQWDFTPYPVSQLAKSYLDSIHEQPMLCVGAVNPFLFAKVPALQHVMGVRKKIGLMLLYVRCPFRRTINKALGSRRYLIESNDFFALRDLIDLSKGAFAALPVMINTVSKKILEHITDQCLICCDVGVPCNARQACDDPSSLIFPFQEDEIERCKSCNSVFHKPCYRKLTNCNCGAVLGNGSIMKPTNSLSCQNTGDLLSRSSSNLSVGLLSRLFPLTKNEKVRHGKDNDTIILMGSLPSTSL